jgi:hypothetical protein
MDTVLGVRWNHRANINKSLAEHGSGSQGVQSGLTAVLVRGTGRLGIHMILCEWFAIRAIVRVLRGEVFASGDAQTPQPSGSGLNATICPLQQPYSTKLYLNEVVTDTEVSSC